MLRQAAATNLRTLVPELFVKVTAIAQKKAVNFAIFCIPSKEPVEASALNHVNPLINVRALRPATLFRGLVNSVALSKAPISAISRERLESASIRVAPAHTVHCRQPTELALGI